MNRQILIGTQNRGKLHEYRRLLADASVTIIGLDDLGLGILDVEETGTSFEENAILKARAYAEAANMPALADDSGIVVDALDGRPGIYSARYGGAGLDDAGRRQKLLAELDDIPDEQRTARFVCVIALVDPINDEVIKVRGTCEGRILHEERDQGRGFGYDPVFLPDGYLHSFGELHPGIKNDISHRGVAAKKLIAFLMG